MKTIKTASDQPERTSSQSATQSEGIHVVRKS